MQTYTNEHIMADAMDSRTDANSTFNTVQSLSRVRLFATPWTVAHQTPPSMESPRQEYWSGLPLPFPGDLPNLGIEHGSPTLWADALLSEPPGSPNLQQTSHQFRNYTFPAVLLLGIYLEETLIRKVTCPLMFIAALFTIAKTWKQSVCQQMNG